MTAAIVIGILAVAAMAYVVAPVGRLRKLLDDDATESVAEEMKRVALTGILDLEEERDAGKLSDGEFSELRARYEHDAVVALRALDERSQEPIEERLEREIAGAREKLRCGTCGASRGMDATRCPSCGSSY